MKFQTRCTIRAAPASVWDFIMDVERVALCVSGVEHVAPLEDGAYEGRVRVKVGPVALAFQGTVRIEERAPDEWRSVLRAAAMDRKQGGRFEGRLALTLVERELRSTELQVALDVTLFGKLGELGQPVVRRKIDALLGEFAERVGAELAPASEPAPVTRRGSR